MKKNLTAIALVLALAFSISVPVFAEADPVLVDNTGFEISARINGSYVNVSDPLYDLTDDGAGNFYLTIYYDMKATGADRFRLGGIQFKMAGSVSTFRVDSIDVMERGVGTVEYFYPVDPHGLVITKTGDDVYVLSTQFTYLPEDLGRYEVYVDGKFAGSLNIKHVNAEKDDLLLLLTTDAHSVKAGDSIILKTAFNKEVDTNAAILTYTFNTEKFEYVGFTGASGITVLKEEELPDGRINITVMRLTYDTKDYGEIILRAKNDAVFDDDYETVYVSARYVFLKDKQDIEDKEIRTADASARISTFIQPESFTLLDLSYIVELFNRGIDNTHPGWITEGYVLWDFNRDGKIDTYDIVFVAQRIR